MKTWIKNSALLFVALLTVPEIIAQITIEKRLEIEMNDGYVGETVIPGGKNGFVIMSRSKSRVEGAYEWKHEVYNNALELQKTESIFIPKGNSFTEPVQCENTVHYMYHKRQKDAHIITYVKSTGSIKDNEVEIPEGFKLYELPFSMDGNLNYAAENGMFYHCGKFEKAPAVVAIDIEKGESTVIPIFVDGIKPNKLKFYGIYAITGTNEFAVIMESKRSRKFNNTYCLVFDKQGNQKAVVNLNPSVDVNLNSVSLEKMDERNYAITGAYSTRSKQNSEGIYFGKFNNSGVEFLKIHNYTSMKTFFDYLSDRKQEKIERKIEKAKEKGKELSYNYLMTSHKIMKLGNRFIYVGEAFYPTYRTETTYVNGKPQTRRVFDGYQYTHGLVVGFDSEGNKVWDQTMTLYQVYKPMYVKQFIRVGVNPNGNTVDLAFASNWNIYKKQINSEGGLVQDIVSKPNTTNDPNEKVRQSSPGELEYWYDNYFINYGFQKIKNTEDKSKRRVFYVNKIQF
jgi:hypothetical protein